MDVREEGGGGGGCREGEWGRRDWAEKEKGKEREGEVGYIFLLYVGPTYTHPTWRQVAKNLTAWLPHKHTNGQTSLTVQPGYFLNTLVTCSANPGLLLVQGVQRSSVVTSGAD